MVIIYFLLLFLSHPRKMHAKHSPSNVSPEILARLTAERGISVTLLDAVQHSSFAQGGRETIILLRN